jgi:hypothetical protein
MSSLTVEASAETHATRRFLRVVRFRKGQHARRTRPPDTPAGHASSPRRGPAAAWPRRGLSRHSRCYHPAA